MYRDGDVRLYFRASPDDPMLLTDHPEVICPGAFQEGFRFFIWKTGIKRKMMKRRKENEQVSV
jgi:hypothetical protein